MTWKKRQVSTDSEREVTRVQMDLSPRSMERLRLLKAELDAASYAEVIREALKLYEFLVREDVQGTSFFMKKKDDTNIGPIKLFF